MLVRPSQAEKGVCLRDRKNLESLVLQGFMEVIKESCF